MTYGAGKKASVFFLFILEYVFGLLMKSVTLLLMCNGGQTTFNVIDCNNT
ncbi:hypothetical protein SAMN05216496_2701 [Pseudomonas sp. Z003-0.4C(8344-21)]|nr:hypothetical protein SAMN05216496_2701 [Pseudomonas sp. Z003-0.4C(8344-21)]